VVFLSYNLIAGNVMKEIYDFARYDFYVGQYLKIATYNSRFNVYARTIFRKKLKSFSITQDITFILGKVLK
jgi:hypothetical protein